VVAHRNAYGRPEVIPNRGWPGHRLRCPGGDATRGSGFALPNRSAILTQRPLAAAPPGQASCPGHPPGRGRVAGAKSSCPGLLPSAGLGRPHPRSGRHHERFGRVEPIWSRRADRRKLGESERNGVNPAGGCDERRCRQDDPGRCRAGTGVGRGPPVPRAGDWSEEEYLALNSNRLVAFSHGRVAGQSLRAPVGSPDTASVSGWRPQEVVHHTPHFLSNEGRSAILMLPRAPHAGRVQTTPTVTNSRSRRWMVQDIRP
jgi:hypothetical protein